MNTEFELIEHDVRNIISSVVKLDIARIEFIDLINFIDSVSVVDIIVSFESHFGIKIDLKDIVKENFLSIQTMAKLIEKNMVVGKMCGSSKIRAENSA